MRIYDCFTFYDEIKLLKLRLKLLAPYVDFFVIVECDHTQRGAYKGFKLSVDDDGVREYIDKIRYIKVEDAPQVQGIGQWEIEHYQRNCILRGLYDCREDDLVMVSDLDEIPSPNILANLENIKISRHFSGYEGRKKERLKQFLRLYTMDKNLWRRDSAMDLLEYTPISFHMRMFYYYMNCEAKSGWFGTVMTKFKNLVVPQTLRMKAHQLPSVDGGWHFSYLGGIEKIKLKLRSIVDDNPAIIEVMEKYGSDDDYIKDCIEKGKDIYGRKGGQFEYSFIDIDEIGLPNIKEIYKCYPEFFR